MSPIHVIEFLGAERSRVANATRTDVTQLSAECDMAERGAVLRAAAGASGEEPLSRMERALVIIEFLWKFEDDWRARSAPGAHMETEWGGGAPT